MATMLIVLGALPWLVIFLYLITRHGIVVLLIWFLIAPLVTNLVNRNYSVAFQTAGAEKQIWEAGFYQDTATTITFQELIEPTRTLLGLFLVIFVLNVVLKKTRLVPMDRTETWMSIFSIILVANVLLWSGRLAFGLHVASDAFIVPFLVYYFTRRFVTSEYRFHQLTRAIGYMGFYVIIYCLFERFTISDPFYRLRGLFEVRDTLYVVMAVVFFTTLLALLCNRHPRKEQHGLPRSMQWFVIVMAPVIILLTITRGNWIAFLSGVFVFFLLGHRLISFARQVRIVGLLFVLLPVLIVILQLSLSEEFFQGRIANPDNVLGRLATWKATIQLASEAPIFGIGLNNLHGALGNMRVNFGDFENYNTPHNSFLSMLVELGAIGLFAYLAIIASIIQNGLNLYRKGRSVGDRWRGITVVAIIVAYQVPSLFATTFYIPGLIHIYVYAFVGAIAGLYSTRQSVSKSYVVDSAAKRQVLRPEIETGGYALRAPSRARLR